MQVRTNVLKNRKPAHLRLDHRRKAVKLVGIAGLERVLVNAPVRRSLEKETAEVVSASEENQQHRSDQETLPLTFPIPPDDASYPGAVGFYYQPRQGLT